MKSFTLVTVHSDALFVHVRSWKRFSPKYLKAWVLNKLRLGEEWEGPIKDVQLYEGDPGDDFTLSDLEKFPRVYLDIC